MASENRCITTSRGKTKNALTFKILRSVRFFLKTLILMFSKDTFNWSKQKHNIKHKDVYNVLFKINAVRKIQLCHRKINNFVFREISHFRLLYFKILLFCIYLFFQVNAALVSKKDFSTTLNFWRVRFFVCLFVSPLEFGTFYEVYALLSTFQHYWKIKTKLVLFIILIMEKCNLDSLLRNKIKCFILPCESC